MMDNFNKNQFSKTYVPAPGKPRWFDRELDRISSGNLRVVWGMDVTTFRAGDPHAPKYPWVPGLGLDRWVMEVKLPLGFFGPRDKWEEVRYSVVDGKTIDMLGPYPDQEAHWGMLFPLVDVMGGYLPCDERVLKWARWHRRNVESRPVGKYASLANYRRMMEDEAAEEAERKRQIEENGEILYDYSRIHEAELNANRAYSIPGTSIYTPPEPLIMTFPSKLVH